MAMTIAGIFIGCKSFDVDGGIIDMDSNGPTGIVREAAVNIITKAMEKKTYHHIQKYIKEGLSICCQFGLTSVQSNDESAVSVYKLLQETDELPIRVFLTPTYDDINKSETEGGLEGKPPLQPLFQNISPSQLIDMNSVESKLIIERVKIFSDGSLGAETAALRQLTDGLIERGAAKGVLMYTEARLCAMMSEARQLGYRLEVHAIGDAAAEQVC